MDALFVLPRMAAGGGERQFVTLAEGLTTAGYDVRAIVTSDHGGDHLREDFERFLLAEPFSDPETAIGYIAALLDCHQPRALVFHENDLAVCALEVSSHRPEVVALIKHTVWENDARFAVREDITAAVTHYICVSEHNAHHLRGFGIGEERIHPIRNGVQPSSLRFRGGREAARAELEIPDDAFVVLHLGRLTENKGTALTIMALAHLPKCYGLFVGWGDQAKMLAGVADKYRMNDRFQHYDAVSDVRRFYAAADVLLLPTKAEGGIPYVVMEAAHAGVAVASTPVSDIPTVFDESYFELERNVAHIQQVLLSAEKHRDQVGELGAAAKEIAREHLTAERMTAEYERVLFGAPSSHRRLRK